MDQTAPAALDIPGDSAATTGGTLETTGLNAIGRLAGKVSALVELLEATRRELAEARQEVEQLRRNLDDRDLVTQQDRQELEALRTERAQLQSRVAAILDQLEAVEL